MMTFKNAAPRKAAPAAINLSEKAVAGSNATARECAGATARECAGANARECAGPIPFEVWDRVCVRRRTPMQHSIWLRACVETFRTDCKAEVFNVGDGAQPSAMAAFSRAKFAAGARLFLPGAEELGEPTDLLYTDGIAASALADLIARTGLAVRFGHYPEASPIPEALKAAYKGKGLVAISPTFGSPYITLDHGWRAPETKFSKRRRGDFRRMQRKAEALGVVRCEVLSPSPADVDRQLESAIAVEAGSWKLRSGTALAVDQENAAFFRRYARYASEAGILRVCFLRIGDAIAAMQVAVECDDAFWLFKIGYDETFKSCSPGNLLMLHSVKYAAERGLAAFEFLGKAAPWTRVWTQTERSNIRLRTYPFNASGLAALAADGLAISVKRVREKIMNSGKPHVA